jgi:DNA replication and repair protein RecF
MLADLHLQHFRSYKDDSFEFSPGVNIIVGPNASGKTNLLEAILLLATGKSYRVSDNNLIHFDESWSRLDAHLPDDSTRTIKLNKNNQPYKLLEIYGKQYKRFSQNIKLPIVLFEPNHLQLLSGGPENRRVYLDDLIEQKFLNYAKVRRDYTRILSQRNSLLKQPNLPSQAQLFPWNIRLSQLAGKIVQARHQLVKDLNSKTNKLYKELSNTETELEIKYDHKWPVEVYETQLLKNLELSADDDHARGFTSRGPHREDLIVTYNSHGSQNVASRGEIRTAILSLKMAEIELLDSSGEKPIILLDDVFSELDGYRRKSLTNYLESYQTFITTTDADLVIDHFSQTCNLISLG